MLRCHQVSASHLSTGKMRISQLKALGRQNCHNYSDTVDFNKYGSRNGLGLIPVSDFFIDTVMIQKMPSCNDLTCDKNVFVSCACKFLNVKAIELGLSHKSSFYCCGKSKDGAYIWKYACAYEPIPIVLSFLADIQKSGYKTYVVDITRDFAGSFDLIEIVNHFETSYNMSIGFSTQNIFMEKDLTMSTGNTCFICKDPSGTRRKMYLKLPQMLQTCKVREDLGNRWFDWIHSKNDKFCSARDMSSDRGLSRVEISIACVDGNIPTIEYLRSELNEFTSMIPPHLIWCSSHVNMWRAYADCFVHTLIVVDELYKTSDKKVGLAIIIYAYNRQTKDLTGFTVTNWKERGRQILARYTLSCMLPIDLITITPISKRKGEEFFEVSGARYMKEMVRGQQDVTYISDKKGSFKCLPEMTADHMTKCGFIPHANVHPFIATKKFQINSLIPATVHLESELDIILPDAGSFLKTTVYDKVTPIISQSNPLSVKSSPQSFWNMLSAGDSVTIPYYSTTLSENCINPFSHHPIVKLQKLVRGYYDVLYIYPTCSPNEYPKLLINSLGLPTIVCANDQLKAELSIREPMCEGGLIIPTKIGTLSVLSHKKKSSGTFHSNVGLTFL